MEQKKHTVYIYIYIHSHPFIYQFIYSLLYPIISEYISSYVISCLNFPLQPHYHPINFHMFLFPPMKNSFLRTKTQTQLQRMCWWLGTQHQATPWWGRLRLIYPTWRQMHTICVYWYIRYVYIYINGYIPAKEMKSVDFIYWSGFDNLWP